MNEKATHRQKRAGQSGRTESDNRLTAEIIRSEDGDIQTRYNLGNRTYDSIDSLPTREGRQ